jgi:hypothetical protein
MSDNAIDAEVLAEKRVVCPHCRQENFFARRTADGQYRCSGCGAALRDPFASRFATAMAEIGRGAHSLLVYFVIGALFLAGGLFWIERSLQLFLAVAGLAALAWVLAKFYRGSMRLNGTGTSYYGRTPTSDGYITTKWLTLFFAPLLPIESCEILHSEPGKPFDYGIGYEENTKLYTRPAPLAIDQVLRLIWIPLCLLIVPAILLAIF